MAYQILCNSQTVFSFFFFVCFCFNQFSFRGSACDAPSSRSPDRLARGRRRVCTNCTGRLEHASTWCVKMVCGSQLSERVQRCVLVVTARLARKSRPHAWMRRGLVRHLRCGACDAGTCAQINCFCACHCTSRRDLPSMRHDPESQVVS